MSGVPRIPERFFLTPQERIDPLWLKLRAWMREELASRRERNDEGLDEHHTASLRGEIKLLKSILKLDAERPIIQTPKGDIV